MLQPNDNWTEFDWEAALRESDMFAHRYFDLLKRFCDLPGADELIARHMGPDFDPDLFDFDIDMQMSREEWEALQESGGDIDEADDVDEEGAEDEEPDPSGSLFYETNPVFVAIRQAAIGWCNVYAAILPADMRPKGLKVLYYIGRALANLAYSIDDGSYEQPQASVAFSKRSLANLNLAIGEINQLVQDCPRLEKVLLTIRNHLVRGADGVVDQVQACRRKPRPEN